MGCLVVLLLLAVPFVDIYSLVRLADVIGGPNTFLVAVAGGLLGYNVGRAQAALSAQLLTRGGEGAGRAIQEGILVFMAATLLVFPGVVSDAIAVPLLVAPIRRFLAPRLLGSVAVLGGAGPQEPERVRVGKAPKASKEEPKANPFSTPFD
jgi:UPF0716 protein FxsA